MTPKTESGIDYMNNELSNSADRFINDKFE